MLKSVEFRSMQSLVLESKRNLKSPENESKGGEARFCKSEGIIVYRTAINGVTSNKIK